MKITVNEIAALVNGIVEGDGTQVITHPAKIEEAGVGGLSFLANPKYLNHVFTTHATAILINQDAIFNAPVKPALIRVKDAYAAMAQLLEIYQTQLMQQKRGIESPSYIDSSTTLPTDIYIGAFAYIGRNVTLGKNVKIFPQVYIGDNVQIGDDSIIYPGVKVYDACIIGKACTIHSGTVIGSDGFGFAPQFDGSYKKVPQTGNVIIEDNVEIGSNSTIDRATMGSTVIHTGSKLDNLIQIAHNVEIGAHTVIAAQAGISGSTKIGQYCRIGGQSGFAGHLQIADKTQVNAQSGVGKSIETPGTSISGAPAFDYRQWQRASIAFRQLPEFMKQMSNKSQS